MKIIPLTSGDIKNVINQCSSKSSPCFWKLTGLSPFECLAAISIDGNLVEVIFSSFLQQFMILQSYLGAGEIGIIRAPRNIPPADEENLNVRPVYRVVEEQLIFGTGYG